MNMKKIYEDGTTKRKLIAYAKAKYGVSVKQIGKKYAVSFRDAISNRSRVVILDGRPLVY